jgi:hypothetical protein
MKRIKNIAFSALLAIGTFGIVTFTACTKDECEGVVCNNGGTCAGGACSCPVGYEGASCETQTRTLYVGDYKGSGSDNTGGTYTNWTFSFSSVGSTATSMEIALKNATGTTVLTLPANLETRTTFTIPSTTVGSVTYAGTGTITATTASATITQTNPSLVLTFANLFRQ